MEAHILDHLIATGVLAPDGTGRRARAHTCPRCGTRVLTGDDADKAALVVTVDPAPLNPLGEALALLEGRRTYDLALDGDRLELRRRDRHWIATRPAGAWPLADVVATHVCGRRLGIPWTTTSNHTRTAAPVADKPPF